MVTNPVDTFPVTEEITLSTEVNMRETWNAPVAIMGVCHPIRPPLHSAHAPIRLFTEDWTLAN